MLKHYVEFLFPGVVVAETSIQATAHRDPDRLVVPKNSFGFRFFDSEEVDQDGETLKGKPKNHSPWYYIGERWDLDRVKRETPRDRILISNMEDNGYPAVVRTKFGQAFPLRVGDVVLERSRRMEQEAAERDAQATACPDCAALREQVELLRTALRSLAYSDGHFKGDCSRERCHPKCAAARAALSAAACQPQRKEGAKRDRLSKPPGPPDPPPGGPMPRWG